METYAYNQVAATWEISHNIEPPPCSQCDTIMEFLRLGWKMMFAPELLEISETNQAETSLPQTNSSVSYA
ncbi:MAG: hypothetical protein QNJ68_19090 [Microcoleaceae cyanobacterium MO_207.B10]|nr:hypothetical protein [Microcoleaceae cyanobacterium MO_207.B10]